MIKHMKRYLVVGLGNPGKKYEMTRHNAGFLVVEYLAEQLGVRIDKIKFKALIGEYTTESGAKIILMKPQTFMNLSGEAVSAAMHYYDIPPRNLLVIYDDIDIDTGQLRVRKKGSAGTHNGMRNILYHLETEDFPRLRIGVGPKRGELVDYVLTNFSKADTEKLRDVVEKATSAIKMYLDAGIDKAMNAFNAKPAKEPKESKPPKEPKAAQENADPADGAKSTDSGDIQATHNQHKTNNA